MILITVISLFVLGLLVYVIVKFNAKANPVPSKTSHHTLIEVIWTAVPTLIQSLVKPVKTPSTADGAKSLSSVAMIATS